MRLLSVLLFFLCAANILAMQNYNPNEYLKMRADWEAEPFKHNISSHGEAYPNGPVRILLGHCGFTVEGLSPEQTLQRIQREKLTAGEADIPYHFILTYPSENNNCYCFEGRPLEKAPAMYFGHNAGSCGVAFLGNTCDLEITDKALTQWGQQLGRIAQLIGLAKLEREKTIVAQCELLDKKTNKCKYPISPGPAFMKHFDELIAIANEWLEANPPR